MVFQLALLHGFIVFVYCWGLPFMLVNGVLGPGVWLLQLIEMSLQYCWSFTQQAISWYMKYKIHVDQSS